MIGNKAYTSTLPLDVGQLDALTEGKHTFQEELLEIFFFNASECIEVMERNCIEGNSPKWKDAAEELNNLSKSIGALELSKICTTAAKVSDSGPLEKKKMIANVRANIHKLRVFIRNTRY